MKGKSLNLLYIDAPKVIYYAITSSVEFVWFILSSKSSGITYNK